MRTSLAVLAAFATVIALPAVPAFSTSHQQAPTTLRVGEVLGAGNALRSPDGRYTARMQRDGRLVLRDGRRVVWHTHRTGAHPRLVLRHGGNLVVFARHRVLWTSNTAGSGARRLVLGNDGLLAVHSRGGTVWTTRSGNACLHGPAGKRVMVDISRQVAKLCNGRQQVLTTLVTTGMSAYGYGTPTGTWHLNGKYRDTTLYPSSGGAYHVNFWMPYDGNVYGMHDANWQRIPFGSPKYKRHGSHGCVHFPRRAIAWMFRWAPIGMQVTIRS